MDPLEEYLSERYWSEDDLLREVRADTAERGPSIQVSAEAGAPAEVDETAAHQRDPLADPDRLALAGRPDGVRALAVGVRAVPSLAAGRDLADDHHCAAGPGRRGRARDLGRLR